MQSLKEYRPSRVKHLNQDVVMNIRNEMGHLMVSKVESVEFSLQLGAQSTELLLVRHCGAPRETERVLDLL